MAIIATDLRTLADQLDQHTSQLEVIEEDAPLQMEQGN